MIRRAWIVVSVVWTGFWVFLYILGAQGLTAAEQLSLRANTTPPLSVKFTPVFNPPATDTLLLLGIDLSRWVR